MQMFNRVITAILIDTNGIVSQHTADKSAAVRVSTTIGP